MKKLIREIHPEIKIVDAAKGIVDYVASDESLDSFREIIRADGWRFTRFRKNAPFVDSHDYYSLDKLLGKVIDFRVEGRTLVERVQWAIDVAENKMAQLGWKMTQAGYLKAVSVGFFPVRYVFPDGSDNWKSQLKDLGLAENTPVRTIYTEQEQIELSAVIIGANPNALAKAYKSGAIDDSDLDTLSQEYSKRQTAPAADPPADAAEAYQRGCEEFLRNFQNIIKKI